MKCTFFLPYFNYNDSEFDVDNNYYSSNEEYFEVMQNEIKKTSKVVDSAMNSLRNGRSIVSNNYNKNSNYNQSKNEIAYSKCEGELFCENGEEETIDGIFDSVFKSDVALYIIKFDIDNAEEEFESALKQWVDEHNNILKYADGMGDDWVFEHEPKMRMIIEVTNHAGENKRIQMNNCKILEKSNISTYVIIADNLELI